MRSELIEQLAARIRASDVRALARACRLVDDRIEGHRELLRALFPYTGGAFVIGITGPPGAGKSTLTDGLIREFRKRGERVAVLCVDPSSPFTGGAILGDRVRMQQHFEDPEVFIRSVATRGALGGLSRSSTDLLRLFDAWQAKVVLVETVGVGQDELEVARATHSVVVVLAPGLGDDVQAIKAGILECADVFVVNKADREGADVTVRDLTSMIALGNDLRAASASHGHSAARLVPAETSSSAEHWTPQVLKCIATRAQGLAEVVAALDAHRAWLEGTPAGAAVRRARAREHLLWSLRDALAEAALERLGPAIDAAAARVEERSADPYTVCDELVAELTRTFR